MIPLFRHNIAEGSQVELTDEYDLADMFSASPKKTSKSEPLSVRRRSSECGFGIALYEYVKLQMPNSHGIGGDVSLEFTALFNQVNDFLQRSEVEDDKRLKINKAILKVAANMAYDHIKLRLEELLVTRLAGMPSYELGLASTNRSSEGGDVMSMNTLVINHTPLQLALRNQFLPNSNLLAGVAELTHKRADRQRLEIRGLLRQKAKFEIPDSDEANHLRLDIVGVTPACEQGWEWVIKGATPGKLADLMVYDNAHDSQISKLIHKLKLPQQVSDVLTLDIEPQPARKSVQVARIKQVLRGSRNNTTLRKLTMLIKEADDLKEWIKVTRPGRHTDAFHAASLLSLLSESKEQVVADNAVMMGEALWRNHHIDGNRIGLSKAVQAILGEDVIRLAKVPLSTERLHGQMMIMAMPTRLNEAAEACYQTTLLKNLEEHIEDGQLTLTGRALLHDALTLNLFGPLSRRRADRLWAALPVWIRQDYLGRIQSHEMLEYVFHDDRAALNHMSLSGDIDALPTERLDEAFSYFRSLLNREEEDSAEDRYMRHLYITMGRLNLPSRLEQKENTYRHHCMMRQMKKASIQDKADVDGQSFLI